MPRLTSLLLLACAGLAQPFSAPGPQPGGSPHPGGGRITEIDALAVDAAGRIAPDLTAADFAFQAPKPVRIASCRYIDTRSRRTVVFLVDDLGLTAEAIGDVRAALEDFAGTIHPDDRVAVWRSGHGEGAWEQLTGEKETLRKAIARLEYNPRRAYYTLGAARTGAFNTGAMGSLRQVVAGLSPLPGRKSVVLFSLGLADQPVADLDSLVADVRRAQVSVYGIDPSIAHTHLDEKGIAGLARATGGELLAAENALSQALAQAVSGPDGYYRIGYHEPEMGLGRPQLALLRSGFQLLSSRPASETLADPLLSAATERQDELPRAMSDPFSTGRIGTRITPLFSNTPQGSALTVLVHLDTRDLTFRRGLDGVYHGGVRILVAIFGSTAQSLEHREESFDVTWNESQYRQGLLTGVMAAAELRVPAAMLQVCAVVSDTISGRMGSASQWIEVPSVEDGRLEISGIELLALEDSPTTGRTHPLDPGGSEAMGVLRAGRPVGYRCTLYNPALDRAGIFRGALQITVFRNGDMVVANQPMALQLPAGKDPRRLAIEGHFIFPAKLRPGHYVMRLTIADKPANGGPQRAANQFVDFELGP